MNPARSELATHADFDAGRLTSLPHSIELSLRSSRMSEAASRLFRLLGQLPAGVVAEDRDALLGADGFRAEAALLRIGLAVERGGRLDLLSPIREHASRHHVPLAGDRDQWPRHYLAMTRRLGEAIGRQEGAGAVSRLAAEFANIEASVRAVLRAGRRDEAMAALDGFRRLAFLASVATPVLSELAEACRVENDLRGEANCIKGLGEIALLRSDHEAARNAFEEALPLYRTAGSLRGEANCLHGHGEIALAHSDHAAARKAFDEAL